MSEHTAEFDQVRCVHCGHVGPARKDHSCPCPHRDQDCPDHAGCDCTELCSMGPTCPGGMLARLPGSGCYRSGPGVVADPTCRACYAATLTPDERERFYAEPVTSYIYWCDDHQRAMDEVLNSLPQVQYIKATMATFDPPEFATIEHDCATCADCLHDGNKCCGCYDGACCLAVTPSVVPHLYERDRLAIHVCTCGRAYDDPCHEPFRAYEPREVTTPPGASS